MGLETTPSAAISEAGDTATRSLEAVRSSVARPGETWTESQRAAHERALQEAKERIEGLTALALGVRRLVEQLGKEKEVLRKEKERILGALRAFTEDYDSDASGPSNNDIRIRRTPADPAVGGQAEPVDGSSGSPDAASSAARSSWERIGSDEDPFDAGGSEASMQDRTSVQQPASSSDPEWKIDEEFERFIERSTEEASTLRAARIEYYGLAYPVLFPDDVCGAASTVAREETEFKWRIPGDTLNEGAPLAKQFEAKHGSWKNRFRTLPRSSDAVDEVLLLSVFSELQVPLGLASEVRRYIDGDRSVLLTESPEFDSHSGLQLMGALENAAQIARIARKYFELKYPDTDLTEEE